MLILEECSTLFLITNPMPIALLPCFCHGVATTQLIHGFRDNDDIFSSAPNIEKLLRIDLDIAVQLEEYHGVVILIVISDLVAKRTRAPAYSRALQ